VEPSQFAAELCAALLNTAAGGTDVGAFGLLLKSVMLLLLQPAAAARAATAAALIYVRGMCVREWVPITA
jgi:hypothetical protein